MALEIEKANDFLFGGVSRDKIVSSITTPRRLSDACCILSLRIKSLMVAPHGVVFSTSILRFVAHVCTVLDNRTE